MTTPRGPKKSQDDANRVRDGNKRPQNGHKMAPNWSQNSACVPQITQTTQTYKLVNRRGATLVFDVSVRSTGGQSLLKWPQESRRTPGRPQEAPRQRQKLPRHRQEAPMQPRQDPRRPQNEPKMTPKWPRDGPKMAPNAADQQTHTKSQNWHAVEARRSFSRCYGASKHTHQSQIGRVRPKDEDMRLLKARSPPRQLLTAMQQRGP